MFVLVSFALLFMPFQAAAQTTEPTVTPYFVTNIPGAGPAFFVECRNTTSRRIPSGSDVWVLTKSAIRLDGTILSDSGGRVGPGVTTDVTPGGPWRGIIELRQSMGPSPAVAFGALVRAPFVVPLDAGRHTVAVRCAGNWSADVPFYWEK
jgi:hypothetical protein